MHELADLTAIRQRIDADVAAKKISFATNIDANSAPLQIATYILTTELRYTVHWCGELWSQGAYRVLEDGAVRAHTWQTMDALGLRPKGRAVSDVVDAMRAVAHLSGDVAPPCWLNERRDAAGIIVFCNGLLDTNTGVFSAPSPALFSRNAIATNYVADAPVPVAWLRFLESLWSDDVEAERTLQEIIGYLLTLQTDQQKIFLIVGPKRSGKGTIFRIISALLGLANIAAPTLSSLSGDFGTQSLIGKSVALISDARLSRRTDHAVVAERLLGISGEDHVSVSRKYLADYVARLPVRFCLATNELPRLTDSSGALASRFVMLTVRRSFLGGEDHGLTDRLTRELPGILLWSLEGLRRLTARGYFVQPVSSAEAFRIMEDIGSPIGAFLRDECHLDAKSNVSVDCLYSRFREWCERSGIAHVSTKEMFGRDLQASAPSIRKTRPRTDGGSRAYIYEGIGFGPSGPGGPSDQPFVRVGESYRRESREMPGPPGPSGPTDDRATLSARRVGESLR